MTSRDAASWAPGRVLHEHAWTRIYRSRGRVAHIWELLLSAHPHAPLSWDHSGEWLGTGSQEEYDQAARMPLCPRCSLMRSRYGQ